MHIDRPLPFLCIYRFDPKNMDEGFKRIVQAEAARIAPRVDMNPILLKPNSDMGSQVVLMGKVLNNQTAATSNAATRFNGGAPPLGI